ncbi:GAF domain-containing sensor histidine kinase [Chloroflexota bacterium]
MVTITTLAIIHYLEAFTGISTIEKIGSVLGLDLTRHTLERILFLIPVAYGAAMLGVKGGLITLGLTFIVLFPRAFLLSPEPREALFETGGIILTGALIVSLVYALEKEKRRLIELEMTQRMLGEKEKSQEEILKTNRELSILNHITYALNQSLDLEVIMQAVAETMLDTLEVQASWVRLSDRTSGIPGAQANNGVPVEMLDKLMETVSAITSGEEMAASACRSLALANDTDSCARPLCHFAITSLKSKGIMVGTAGVASMMQPFDQQSLQLLDAIGNQIVGAVERCRMYEEMQLARDVRGELLHTVISVQEEERKRIARELHDETGQALTALRLGLERLMLGPTSSAEELKDQVSRCLSLCHQADEDIDRIILDLRPALLDDLGLVESIRFYTDMRLGTEGVQVTVRVSGKERRLPGETESAVFRVMQESITNIVKHAHAKGVTVDLKFETDRLVVEIEDDGCGFEVSQLANPQNPRHGLGLLGMRERMNIVGGILNIMSKPGIGTRIKAVVPIAREEI